MQRKADQLKAEVAAISQLLQAGRPDRALKRATKAAKKWPNVAALHRLAGISAVNQQNPRLAQTYFAQAWRLEPNNAELIQNLALSLVQGGDSGKALSFLDRIAARGPLAPQQKFIQALALLKTHQAARALQVINDILTGDSSNPNALLLQADCLDALHRWADAVDVLEGLVDAKPKFLPGLVRLAKAQVGLGRNEDALKQARAALALAPTDAETLELMASLPNLTAEDAAQVQARVDAALAKESAGNLADQPRLRFAAADLARRQKDITQEMQYLAQAHQMQCAGFESWEQRSAKDCYRRLAAPLPAKQPVQPGSRPVFVVGLPRSGTTLVERILARHSGVQGLGELPFVHQWAREAQEQPASWREDNPLAEFYRMRLPQLSADAGSFVDKAPGNYAFLGDIAQAFPNAVIINVQRDPRDVALSMWRANFGAGGLYFTHDLNWMAAEANRYQRYIQHWHAVLPGRIHDIQYEALVSDLQTAAQELARMCDLQFEQAMLTPEQSDNAIKTASSQQARQPVNTASVGRWQTVAEYLQPFIDGLDADLWPDVFSKQS